MAPDGLPWRKTERSCRKPPTPTPFCGSSCHSLRDVQEAEDLGCTYVTLGHIFATDCKKGLPPRGLAFLEEIAGKTGLPVYVIGGIRKDNMLLYAVTDSRWTGKQSLFEQVEAAIKGGVTCVQLREKHLSKEAFLAEALEMKELCHRYGVPLLINDDVEIALASQAVSIPVVDIGSITQDNLPLLHGTGLDGVTLVSTIFSVPDIEEKCREMVKP